MALKIIKRKKTFIILLITCIVLSCKNDVQVTVYNPVVELHFTKDTILLDEYVKGFAYLKIPYFKKSQILVFLENDDSKPLKSDLANENDIPMEVFENLDYDTINRKWITGYDYHKTVAFGKKFNSTGIKKIRGYVLEYKNGSISDNYNVIDTSNAKKYYFEKMLYVKDAPRSEKSSSLVEE